MQDAAPGGHPLNLARTDLTRVPERILVPDSSGEQVSHGLDPAMGVERKAGLVIGRILRSKVIQEQKRIDMVEGARSDASFKPDAGSFNDGLRLYDFCDFSYRCFQTLRTLRFCGEKRLPRFRRVALLPLQGTGAEPAHRAYRQSRPLGHLGNGG